MASVSAAILRRPQWDLRWAGVVAALPLALAVARLLPETGLGLYARLFAAAACLLVLPGALVVRAVGAPASLSLALAASVAGSLGFLFVALVLTFVFEASVSFTIAVVVAIVLAALLPAARARPAARDRMELRALGALLVVGFAFGGLLWWVPPALKGDALFHLARAQKLVELPSLESLASVNEFQNGDLHPGYAVPLWHAVLALVGKLAGVGMADVVVYLPAVLAPLAFMLAYAAGAALFGSWVGGIAVAFAQIAQAGFSRAGTGFVTPRAPPGLVEWLALPTAASRLLLVPAALALVFAIVSGGPLRLLPFLAAAAFAVAVVHPTDAIFVAIAAGGFFAARLLLARFERPAIGRLALALGGLLVPTGVYFVWLLPAVKATASFQPDAAERARGLAHYERLFDASADTFRLPPEAITRGASIVVIGLAVVPLAAFARRRLWSAFVVGTSLALLAVALSPPIFTVLSDTLSLSQTRRLTGFLPITVALAGAAMLLSRLKLIGVALAGATALAAQIAYPTETSRQVEGGPSWPVWIALGGAGATLALLVGFRVWRRAGLTVPRTFVSWVESKRRRRPIFGRLGLPGSRAAWTVAVTLAVIAPIVVTGLASVERSARDERALTPGLVDALRKLRPLEVVFSDPQSAYRVAALAPLYINAAPPAHVANTPRNRPYDRVEDAWRFFSPGLGDAEREAILSRYGADWLLVAKANRDPKTLVGSLEPAYEDDRYALYRLESP